MIKNVEFNDGIWECDVIINEFGLEEAHKIKKAEHIDDVTFLIQENKKLEQRVQTLEQQLVEQSLIIDAIYAKLKELTS